MPHHAVFNPKKPGKLRVVFDCAAKFQGDSLNGHLLQGPNMVSNLVEILLRFRQGSVEELHFSQLAVTYYDVRV